MWERVCFQCGFTALIPCLHVFYCFLLSILYSLFPIINPSLPLICPLGLLFCGWWALPQAWSFSFHWWLIFFFPPKSHESTENQISSVSLQNRLNIYWCIFDVLFTLGNSCVVGQCQIWIRVQRLCVWSSSCVRRTRYHVHPAVSCLLWILTTLLENLKHVEISKGEYEVWLDPWCCFQSGDALYLTILQLCFP